MILVSSRSEVALEPSYAEPEKVMKLPTSNEPKSKATDHDTTLPGYETLYPNMSTSSTPDKGSSTIPVNKVNIQWQLWLTMTGTVGLSAIERLRAKQQAHYFHNLRGILSTNIISYFY